MHIASIDREAGTVTIGHEDRQYRGAIAAWTHPRLPDGGEDALVLTSPAFDGDAGAVSMTIDAHGDAGAQQMFAALSGLWGETLAEIRQRVEDAGAAWHLTEDGEHAALVAARAVVAAGPPPAAAPREE